VQEVEALGRVGLAHPVDVTKPADVQALAEAALERFGRIDILVNCAGILEFGRVATYDPADWERVIRVNLIGCFLATQAVLGAMLRARQGRIINIASTAAKQGFPLASAYSASKHGIVGLTKSLAGEVAGANITVNAICPGFVNTNMAGDGTLTEISKHSKFTVQDFIDQVLLQTPQRRFLDPEEIAALAVYLASDEARGMTGQAVSISGGFAKY
jgi:NAD(P)-dependent dehydrogenase (short-subunit alcohol dehydrogenase family)